MASRDKKATLTKKQTTVTTEKEEAAANEAPLKLIPASEIKEEFPKTSAPAKQVRKPTGLKKKDPKKVVVKRTFKINLKAKTKVNAKGKTILTKGGNLVKKKLLKNGVTKAKVIRRKPQTKQNVDNEGKPPVLEPILADNSIEKKLPVKKKVTPKKADAEYCSISETIESIISQSGGQKQPLKKPAKKPKEASVVDTISESIEDVVRELQFLIKTEDIKKENDTGSESGKNDKTKPIKRKAKVDLIKKKLKKENIENELNKIDTSNRNSKVIDMLDLNVAKTKSKIVENRRHSIEKFPIGNQDVKTQNATTTATTTTTVFSNVPRSISPRNKRQIKLRQSLDSKRNTRSDSPARILRNGKHRKHLHLLDGIDSEYKKRKRLCSDYSGSEMSNSKLSGYESDSSFSDLASLHGGENADAGESPPTKESLLKKELLETLENNPPDNVVNSVTIKRSLSLESGGKEVENRMDTNFNFCENEEHASPIKIEEDVFMETISPSFKVPEKSIILNIMKQTFNGVIEEQQEIEKRKTRSAAKKDTEDDVPGVSTSVFYGNVSELEAKENVKEPAVAIAEEEEEEEEEEVKEAAESVQTEEKAVEEAQQEEAMVDVVDNNNLEAIPSEIIESEKAEQQTNGDDDLANRKIEIVETPESLVIKHQILQALGLQTLKAAEEAKLRKLVPRNDSYTGTLKTVIKLSRNDKKKGRTSLKMTLAKRGKVHGKDDDPVRPDEDEYKIMKEGSSSTWKAHHGGQSSDTAGAQRKSHYSNRINMDGSSEHTSDGDTNANEEGAGKVLVIPEKASSFSIHPGRLCKDECSYCFGKFGLFDTPCHIAQMKSVDRQNKILAAEKHLTRDSCLCDACYRHVDRKSNTPSYSNNKSVKRNLSLVAPGPRQNHCHVLGCGLIATNILRRKWLIKMRKSVCQVINIDLDNPGLHSIPICEEHYNSLEHLMVCAMCKRKLARNHIHYLGPESNDLNTALNEMGVPVKLNDKPVVCKLCRFFASLVLKNPEDRVDSSLHFYREYKKRLLHFHDIEVMDEAEAEEPIPAPMKDKEIVKKKKKSQKNQNLEPPILEPQIDVGTNEEPKNRVPLTDSESPSDILIDYNTLIPNIAMECGGATNDIEMTRREISKKSAVSIKRISKTESEKSKKLKHKSDIAVQRLGSNPSISVRQLFPGEEDLPLNGNIEFHNVKERTPEGWEKCVSTIQYDPEVKNLWSELQKPYGNQSSFLRHLILLEKYFRNGDLVLAPNATHHSVNYSESVQNRLRAYDNVPTSKVSAVQLPVSVVAISKPQQKSVSGIITSKEIVVTSPPTPPPLPPPMKPITPPTVTVTAAPIVPKIVAPIVPPLPLPPLTVTPVASSFLVPNPAAIVGATVTMKVDPVVVPTPPPPSPSTPTPPPPPALPVKPKLPPGLISLQPGTKIPITPLVKVPQSQKIKFPITKNWRPNLIPIDPAKKPEKKPGLVQVISGGKPYHITLEDYKKMCAIKRTFDLRQKRLQEAQKNSGNSILKNMPIRKGLVISKSSSSTIVSPTKTESDPEIENSLEKLDRTVEKLEAKLIDGNKMVMPKIPKSLTVIPQTVAKKSSRPTSPAASLLITPKNKPSTGKL